MPSVASQSHVPTAAHPAASHARPARGDRTAAAQLFAELLPDADATPSDAAADPPAVADKQVNSRRSDLPAGPGLPDQTDIKDTTDIPAAPAVVAELAAAVAVLVTSETPGAPVIGKSEPSIALTGTPGVPALDAETPPPVPAGRRDPAVDAAGVPAAAIPPTAPTEAVDNPAESAATPEIAVVAGPTGKVAKPGGKQPDVPAGASAGPIGGDRRDVTTGQSAEPTGDKRSDAQIGQPVEATGQPVAPTEVKQSDTQTGQPAEPSDANRSDPQTKRTVVPTDGKPEQVADARDGKPSDAKTGQPDGPTDGKRSDVQIGQATVHIAGNPTIGKPADVLRDAETDGKQAQVIPVTDRVRPPAKAADSSDPAESQPAAPQRSADPRTFQQTNDAAGIDARAIDAKADPPPNAVAGATQAGQPVPLTPAATAAAPQAPPAAAVPVAGLAVEIAARARGGQNRFEIRLDPPELGRIDVHLHVDRHGQVTSHLIADRVDTLDLLRRDAADLQRSLQQAGLKTSDNGLQFSLRDQSFGADANARDGSRTAQVIIPEHDVVVPEIMTRSYLRAGLGSGIDISV